MPQGFGGSARTKPGVEEEVEEAVEEEVEEAVEEEVAEAPQVWHVLLRADLVRLLDDERVA